MPFVNDIVFVLDEELKNISVISVVSAYRCPWAFAVIKCELCDIAAP